MEQQTYLDWITGTDPHTTTEIVFAAGQTIAEKQPLGQVTATGEFKVCNPTANDGSQVATRMSVYAVDTTTGAKKGMAYKAGTFNPELVNWGPGFTTPAQKACAFTGTPISLQTPRDV